MDECTSLMRLVFVTIITGFIINFLLLMIYGKIFPDYVNTVWGYVESEQYSTQLHKEVITVVYSTDDEKYHGTYRIQLTTFDIYIEGEEVLLMTTADYKHATFYNKTEFYKTNTLSRVSAEISKNVKYVLYFAFGALIGAVLFFVSKYLYTHYSPNYRYKFLLDKCSYISPESESSLCDSIYTVKRVRNACKDKSLKSMLSKVLKQMHKQVERISTIDKVIVDGTADHMKTKVDETVSMFSTIASIASEQVYKLIVDGYTDSDIKKLLYQLEAYANL